MKTIVVGDVHNNFSRLNDLINKLRPKGLEMVIACGDFGFWPGMSWATPMGNLKNKDVIIRWCDGNHENHWALKQRKSDEIVPNVFYMPRGSTFDLPDGRKILFMGGADSIDKGFRQIGVDWFPEEIIGQGDIQNLPETNIDIVISHTCPDELLEVMLQTNPFKTDDPSNKALSYILEKYEPDLWFLGHWHVYRKILYEDTETLFHALAECTKSNWWKWLPEKGEKLW